MIAVAGLIADDTASVRWLPPTKRQRSELSVRPVALRVSSASTRSTSIASASRSKQIGAPDESVDVVKARFQDRLGLV